MEKMVRLYFITGANSGCGLEAARQLSIHFSQQQENQVENNVNNESINDKVKIYLLCRSEEKAKEAMADIGTSNLEYMKFDAFDDSETIRENIRLSLPPNDDNKVVIGGIILNAGGFGDGNNNNENSNVVVDDDDDDDDNDRCHRRACNIAQLNIIGHAALVNHLISMYRIDMDADTTTRTRIVAVGSEASFASPGMTMDYKTASFVDHLSGTVASKDRSFGIDYGWTKGILALYWAAFARRHPELYVITVSPGAVSNTELFTHKGVSPFLRWIARLSQVRTY
jgi:NAD(P)-dependent dehydrogenase (short-subunit alcohol dehydrogenase family)